MINRRSRLILLAITFAFPGLWIVRGQEPKTSVPAAKQDDVKSIDAIIASLYDVISGDKGQPRDWDRFRSLFVPGARLIPVASKREGGAAARVLSPDEFVTAASSALKDAGFYEKELSRQTQEFGRMAHVFSTYESTREKGGKPFDRGINSIQLMKDGDRWWIVTIYWDRERPESPIPAEFLPKK